MKQASLNGSHNNNIEYVDKIPINEISCKSATKFLIDQKFIPPTAEQRMIQANLNKQTIETIYTIPFRVTKDIRLAIFQFKVVHHILPTNATLFRDKIIQWDNCHLCDQKQTLSHPLPVYTREHEVVMLLFAVLEGHRDPKGIAIHCHIDPQEH